jgi:hypothetical protein
LINSFREFFLLGIIVETPKLIVMYGDTADLPCTIFKDSTLSLIRSAMASAPSASVFGNITMNSSPPYLAMKSMGRFKSESRALDTFFRQASPAR